MRRKKIIFTVFLWHVILLIIASGAAADKLKVVVTNSAYASIAEYVGGDKITVSYIVRGNQDPHIVRPKPSLAVDLAKADLFVATGLDLEMWAPSLVDMSNNPDIRSGQKGFVSASAGMDILEQPVTISRAEGDVHIYGNPHIHTSPLNGKTIAENIYTGLKKIDPANSDYYLSNLNRFIQEIDHRTFGVELTKMIGGETLSALARRGKLIDFLKKKQYKNRPLVDFLGGWMKKALPLYGKKVVTYHKNWGYFAGLFGVNVVDYMEPKPGIPPTPGHIASVIETMRNQNIKVMLAANYFDVGKVQQVAKRVGAIPVIVALAPGGEKNMNSFFDQFDIWIDRLVKAFEKAGSDG
ncbi:MAG: zinc ABC transporter substrate-binding protein [Deltaproteobacteria bacterium]|nr:zinc ABC transporter substrate-binding protein [Deltaproteobacteria bacterium]